MLSGDGTVIFGNKLCRGRRGKEIHMCPVFALEQATHRWEVFVLVPGLAVGGQYCPEHDFIYLRGVAVIFFSLELLAFEVHTSLNSWSVGI